MSVHGGRLVRSVGIAHKSWCWKSASFSSEVLVSSFLESCTGVGGSSQLVLYEARYSLSQRLREVDYRGRSWLRGPSFQQCFQSLFPSASLILMLLRVSHGGVVGLHDVACSAFPGSSSVAPFLVVPLAPFSMAFADGPTTQERVALLIRIVLRHVRFRRMEVLAVALEAVPQAQGSRLLLQRRRRGAWVSLVGRFACSLASRQTLPVSGRGVGVGGSVSVVLVFRVLLKNSLPHEHVPSCNAEVRRPPSR